jgi:hypothetical protein
MASFLSLPNELIQNVAFYLPFSSFVELQCVNQRLHHVCKQRLVLQTIAKNSFHDTDGAKEVLQKAYSTYTGVKLRPEALEWREGDSFLSDASIEVAREIARAVEICTDILLAREGNGDWTLRLSPCRRGLYVGRWLPHLLALRHPATFALEPQVFLRVQNEVKYRDLGEIERNSPDIEHMPSQTWTSFKAHMADLVNVNFILGYVTLQRLSQTRDPKEIMNLLASSLCSVATSEDWDFAGSETKLTEIIIQNLHHRVSGYGIQSNPFTPQNAYPMLPPMILSISAVAACHRDLPKPEKMPFCSFMDIASVYVSSTENLSESFSKCHLHKMTSPESVSGNWMGYYTDLRRAGNRHGQPRIDPPMRDINIIAGPPSEQDTTDIVACAKIDNQSRGVDAHGEFTLEGEIQGNGEVSMVKRYLAHNWAWRWAGCMTPFGIIGSWSSRYSLGGYFWIWKDEWR